MAGKLCFLVLLVLFISLCGISLSAQSLPKTREINIDLNKTGGSKNDMFKQCVGAGRASEGLRADWQQQLLVIQKNIGFKYIRFHGLLCDEMHVYTEDDKGKAVYNWQYVDKLYDFLLSAHIRPFVEFGFMPPALASGDQTVFWWKGNVTPPKSYDKWSALITAMVRHFEDRYGKAEVEKWYFEVWNEPNLTQFFSGDMKQYFKLYEVTAKAVKSVSNTYKVGGPATSGSTWIKESLEYFATIPHLVDFISTHAYGTKSVFDEFGKRRTQMREADGIAIAVRKLRADVDNSPLRGKPIFITEWNSSPNPKDPLHDTYQNATYVLNALKKTEHLVDAMSYWTFTDIFEEAGPPITSFHGGFGLLNLQGIKKLIADLGDTELSARDSSSWICKDKKNNIQALIWDYKLLSPDTSYNQQFYGRPIPPKASQIVRLNINHLKNGKYKMLVYKTGYHINDPYSAYLEMGSPYNITVKQEAALKQMTDGRLMIENQIEIKNGTWQNEFALRQNDICFIKLVHL
jgi:xylan 1,4-beta-xylosidase